MQSSRLSRHPITLHSHLSKSNPSKENTRSVQADSSIENRGCCGLEFPGLWALDLSSAMELEGFRFSTVCRNLRGLRVELTVFHGDDVK